MRCGIALQVKLLVYELPVLQFVKQLATDAYLHIMKENGDQ
jgi:hypothetical protein